MGRGQRVVVVSVVKFEAVVLRSILSRVKKQCRWGSSLALEYISFGTLGMDETKRAEGHWLWYTRNG